MKETVISILCAVVIMVLINLVYKFFKKLAKKRKGFDKEPIKKN